VNNPSEKPFSIQRFKRSIFLIPIPADKPAFFDSYPEQKALNFTFYKR
jgi:hypothetical protein